MITLVSSDGKEARLRTGYTLRNGFVEVARERLRTLGKARSFTPSEYWRQAVTSSGESLRVQGVGVAKFNNEGFGWDLL